MAVLQVVLLLVAFVSTSQAIIGASPFGGLGGFPGRVGGLGLGGAGPRGGFGPGAGPRGGFRGPQMLTCIGMNEARDQLRITIRPENNGMSSSFGPGPMLGSPFGRMGQSMANRKIDWRISAMFVSAAQTGQINPAGTASLIGSFYMGVTKYGRTEGHCAGLGGVLQDGDLDDDDEMNGMGGIMGGRGFGGIGGIGGLGGLRGGFGGIRSPYHGVLGGLGHGRMGGFGGFSGMGGFGGMRGGFGRGFDDDDDRYHNPAGFIEDPIVIAPGGTVYSGVIRRMSEQDIVGRGIAICTDNYCQRPTTTCCTIARDATPASEVSGRPAGGHGGNFVGPFSGATLQNGLRGGGLGGIGLAGNGQGGFGAPGGGLLGGNGGLNVGGGGVLLGGGGDSGNLLNDIL